MQQSSRPRSVYILRRVQRRCVWAVGRLGNESNAGVDRYDRQMHSDAAGP